MRWIVGLVLVLAMCLTSAQAQLQPGRFALVIGNSAYTAPGWALKNPVNDSNLIAARLRALGFEVILRNNASKAQMEAAMNAFSAKVRAHGPSAVGVFFYAGHGVEHDGANLLIPVDIKADTMDELRYQAPPMQYLLRDLTRARNGVNIVILDSCRDLPLPSGVRDGPAGGLAELTDVPDNVLIAYATRPGKTAPDNPDDTNSFFSRTLDQVLAETPDVPVESLFATVQSRVFTVTGGDQRPEFRASLLRAPGWRFANATAVPMANPELDKLRRRNAELEEEARKRLAETSTRPPVVSETGRSAGGSSAPRAAFVEPEMVRIPGGSFVMGSPADETGRETDEGPQRTVSISHFAAGKYEVTFAEWDACAADGGCGGYRPRDEGWGRGSRPVINVSWNDAQTYVQWLSRRTGKTYRLLTEAEWEYAARAGTNTAFPWGDSISHEYANYGTDRCCSGFASGRDQWVGTAPVGRFPANEFGLHDMHGNVFEWVQDCDSRDYNGSPTDATAFTAARCGARILRSGSWTANPRDLRSAARGRDYLDTRSNGWGFRLARTL